ncbi:MAG TPA: diacylglycerol kinase family protein [Terriglobia bacterium]|nr:diacylglycerol kinase family protein [Terriglobia bacterium]
MIRRAAAIVNPSAAGGRAGRLWPSMARQLRERVGDVTVRCTESAGHATALAGALIEAEHDLIIAVGGDGTLSEVANGYLRNDEPIRPNVQLGFLPVGTGSDFRRTLRIPADVRQAIEILATGKPLDIDVGRVTFVGLDGVERRRHFINLVSFGMGGEVAAGAKNCLTAFGGTAAFFGATLRTIASYRGRRIELELDGDGHWLPFFVSNVAVGNGQYHGGGMRPCPTALLSDGVLELTVIDYLNAFEIARDIRVLYSENVYRLPKVHHLRARRLSARADEPTRIEVDGEPLGWLPLEIEVLPRRLPVLVSPFSPLFAPPAAAS